MLSERDRIITLGVIAVLLVAFGVVVWIPARSTQRGFQQRISEAEEKAKAAATKTLDLSALAIEVSKLEERAARYPRTIPETNEISELMRQISAELTRRSVADKAIETRTAINYDAYRQAPLSLRFKGGLADVYAILRQIESMPTLVTVNAVEIESGGRDSSAQPNAPQPPLEIFLDLNTYQHLAQGQ